MAAKSRKPIAGRKIKQGGKGPKSRIGVVVTEKDHELSMDVEVQDCQLVVNSFPEEDEVNRRLFTLFLKTLRVSPKAKNNTRVHSIYMSGETLKNLYLCRNKFIVDRQLKAEDPINKLFTLCIDECALLLGMWNRGELIVNRSKQSKSDSNNSDSSG